MFRTNSKSLTLLPASFCAMFCLLPVLRPAHAAEIHDAVSAKDYLRVERILAQTPDAVKSTVAKGVTPLHQAAALNYADIAELLIRKGADVNARTAAGFTPLHWAAYKNSIDALKVLLKNGANPAAKSGGGVSVLDWAKKGGADGAGQILADASGKKTAPPPLPAKSTDLTFKAQGMAYSRLYTDVDSEGYGEADRSLDSLIRLEAKLGIPEAGTIVFVSGDLRSKMFDMENDSFDPEASVREAYGEVRRKEFAFSLGKQIVTWGKLDEFVILDRISPQDYDWFTMPAKLERKLPVMMLRGEYFGRNFQVESILVPKFEQPEVRFFGTDWAYFGHMKDVIAAGPYPQPAIDSVNAIAIDNPEVTKEAEFAVRIRTRFGDTDYGFYYMNLMDRIPGLKEMTEKGLLTKRFLFMPSAETLQALLLSAPGPADLFIKEDYARNNVAGADFETVAGEYGIRGEFAFQSDQPMNREDLSFVRKDMISGGIGVDHTSANETYFNIQMVGDFILDYEPLYQTSRFANQVILNISRDFMLGDLHGAIRTAYQATYKDWMINPTVSYKIGRGLEAEAGAYLFSGDPWTLFGRFDTKDSVYAEMRYRF